MGYEWLHDYEEWRKRTPQQVLDSVVLAGGWGKAFAREVELPKYAHVVRNFFNREPQGLTLLGENQGIGKLVNLGLKIANTQSRGFKTAFALSGDVYQDEYNVTWFQMDAAGALYHLKKVKNATIQGAFQAFAGQGGTPKFKLISPDGTDGSRETIIKSTLAPPGIRWEWGGGLGPPAIFTKVIGEENHYEVVVSRIDTDPQWRGSYNYAETAVVGFEMHEKLDVKPHERYPRYVNAGNIFSELSSRRFPKLPSREMHW